MQPIRPAIHTQRHASLQWAITVTPRKNTSIPAMASTANTQTSGE